MGPQALHRLTLAVAVGVALAAAAAGAQAVERCELNGESVNPNNGNTTAGKTGLMRCREEGTGPIVREQELQQGRFMGVVRRFKDGVLEREYRVNEQGNREGLARVWHVADGKGVLAEEDTYRNSDRVGFSRTWHPNGQPKRLAFTAEGVREPVAVVEWGPDGLLWQLRCGSRPVLAPHFDDAKACGHAGDATAELFNGRGRLTEKRLWRRGESMRVETFWDTGGPRDLLERNADGAGGTTKAYAADGVLRRETQWVAVAPATGSDRPRQVTVLEREFHERGARVKERRLRPATFGAELVAEETWYLNGQPRDRSEFETVGEETRRRETTFHDNGVKASEGAYVARRGGRGGGGGDRPTGVHRSFDPQGRLRAESTYDERGRIARERVLDENGKVVRDEEVFEDGSRKSTAR